MHCGTNNDDMNFSDTQIPSPTGGQLQSGVMYVDLSIQNSHTYHTAVPYLAVCSQLYLPAQCEPFCLNGTRSRKVWCEESPSGIVRPDCLCDCTMRLSEVEDCFNVPGLDMCYLTPLWRTGEFSKVSSGSFDVHTQQGFLHLV